MSEKVIRVTWGRNKTLIFDNTLAFDAFIAELSNNARESHILLCVEISVNEQTSLMLTTGGSECHLEFVGKGYGPFVSGCIGPWDDDSLLEIDCMDELSEMERRYFVPMADGYAALREYVATGKRPTNINWAQ